MHRRIKEAFLKGADEFGPRGNYKAIQEYFKQSKAQTGM